MRTLNTVFGIVATLSTFAHGSGYTEPAFKLMYNNQSSLFGYQLYGSHIYNTSDACKNLHFASHRLWNLDDFRIQRKLLLFVTTACEGQRGKLMVL
jgi:hypothetical protein